VIGAVLLVIGLCGCTTGDQPPPTVGAEALQKDLTDRLVRDKRPPADVVCPRDLVGVPGRSTRCDVVFDPANSIEAVIETTMVDDGSVHYEVRPRMTKEQTERLVRALTSATAVVCDSGLDDRLATTTRCEVDRNGSKSLRTVSAKRTGDLALDLTVFQFSTKVQVEEQLRQLLVASLGVRPESVKCAGGVLAKKGASVECTAAIGGKKMTYVVRATSVDDNGVVLGAVRKGEDGGGTEDRMDYCRGCPG